MTTPVDKIQKAAGYPTNVVLSKIEPPRPTKEDAPQWKAFTPFANMGPVNDLLKATRKPLSKAQQILASVQSALDKAKSIISILAVFESVINNLIYAFINAIADKLQIILDDAKSTGIYMLDLVSYHFENKADADPQDNLNYLAKIAEGPWFIGTSFSGTVTPVEQAVDNEIKNPVTQTVSSMADSIASTWNYMKDIDMSYKRETYYEYINNICEAFTDPNDVPSGALGYVANEIAAYGVGYTATELKGQQSDISTARFLQSGRPNFGPQASMNVILITAAVPAIDDLFRGINTLLSLFPVDISGDFQAAKKFTDDFTENMKKLAADKIKHAEEYATKRWESIQNFHNVYGTLAGNRGLEPNFIGINMYSLFAPFFDYAQSLIVLLRSFTVTIDTGLAAMLLKIVEGIEKEVERLVQAIMIIGQLVTMIESILAITGFRMLHINTDEGTDGVIRALKNATNFAEGSKTKDKVQARIESNKAQADIKISQKQVDKVNQDLIVINSKKEHLMAIDTMIGKWAIWVNENPRRLLEKRAALALLTAETHMTIEEIDTELSNITNNHLDLPGLVFKRAELTATFTTTMYGGEFLPGLYADKEALETELAQLIADYNNPAKAEPADYATNKIILEQKIVAKQNDIDKTIADYTNAMSDNLTNETEITTDGDYEVQLPIAVAELIAAKNNKNPDFLGGIANTYKLQDESYTTQITDKETEITLLEEENSRFITRMADLNGELANYTALTYGVNNMLNIANYPYTTYRGAQSWEDIFLAHGHLDPDLIQWPPANQAFKSNTSWNIPYMGYEKGATVSNSSPAPVFNPYYNNIWGSQPNGSLSGPPNWINFGLDPVRQEGNLEHYFESTTPGSEGYWLCEQRTIEIPIEISALRNDIELLETAQELNMTNWTNYNATNLRLQNRLVQKTTVLNSEIQKIELGIEKNTLINNPSQEIEELTADINNIIENGFNMFLTNSMLYYTHKTPRSIKQTDDTYVLEDWTNNEVGYLIYKSDYNYREPEVTLVGNIYTCSATQLAISLLTDEKAVKENELKAVVDAHDDKVKTEEKRLAKVEQEENVAWTPDTKMYYGGFLFCVGWPNVTDEKYFNLSDIYSATLKDPGKDSSRKAWDQIKKIIG